jgi:PhnB protein
MLNLTPYLLFDGNCAEAMAFYQSCLGGELTIVRVGDMPTKNQTLPENHGKVTNAHLRSGEIAFSATDWIHPTRRPKQGNTVCMYINGGKYSELRAIFDKLADGADKELLDDLRDLPFGSYGALTDRFGVRWMFQGEKEHEA